MSGIYDSYFIVYESQNPSVLLSPLTTQEAVLSSKIEGTQATLEEVLKFEATPHKKTERYQDIREIINYRQAMSYAVQELKERPLNLIDYLDAFEKYMHTEDDDTLVQVAILHAQFEILHPFLDGNGRIGRILIPLYIYTKNILHQPMFYISAFLEEHRDDYYDHLKAISDNNDWEEWIRFFLTAIDTQARRNTEKAQNILYLYDRMKQRIVETTHSQYALQALDGLFTSPVFSASDFQKYTGIPKASSSRIISTLRNEKIIYTLEEASGRKPAVYIFQQLLDIVNQ